MIDLWRLVWRRPGNPATCSPGVGQGADNASTVALRCCKKAKQDGERGGWQRKQLHHRAGSEGYARPADWASDCAGGWNFTDG